MNMNKVDILFSWICGEDDAEYEALKNRPPVATKKQKLNLPH